MPKFNKPAKPSGLDLKVLNGSLLMITPTRVETGIKTNFGEKDAVVANVTVLDGDCAGQVYRGTLIWPAVLQGQLRPLIGSGDPTLGRLSQGEVMKPGQSPPWVLDPATDADEELATAYLGNGATGAAELGEDGDGEKPPF